MELGVMVEHIKIIILRNHISCVYFTQSMVVRQIKVIDYT